jgi:tryptophan-rich sensory protein
MTATPAGVVAFVICALAAALEGVCAGPGVADRLAALRRPRFTPSLAGWLLIGLGYYVICFTILYRLLRSGWPTWVHRVALVLMLLLLVVNASWNYLFFRRRDLGRSFLLNVPYAAIALSLAVALVRIGDGSVWVFVPYLVYLGYAIWFGYMSWQLNDRAPAA